MRLICLNMALICAACLSSCTDNLRPKANVQPAVHHGISDTVPDEKPKTDTVSNNTGKIAHQALCKYTKLSKGFDFLLSVDMDEDGLGLRAYISIISKENDKKIQSIEFDYSDRFPVSFYDCSARSFTTGLNLDAVNDSGYLGDMVVGDLNFDKREDFAILWNYGAHSAYYRYYIQDDSSHFVLSSYLTNKLESFPTRFDTLNHTFEVDNIVGAWGYNLNAYKFDKEANTFIEIKNQIFDGKSGKMVSGWPRIVNKNKH